LLYQNQNRQKELGKILKSGASDYIPSGFKQYFYFRNYEFHNYFFSYIGSFASNINRWGFFAALAILIVWVIFLVQLDIYEREKWYSVIFAVLLGMFFTFFADALYKFYSVFLHFNLNGNIYNDFLYCWFGIGLIEEIVKIIPFLILLRYFTMINESYDYILYASLTALGFSFIENLIYFQTNQLHIIHGRALSSSLAHMFFSSIIAYGIFLNSFKFP
jgi:RsiW-degrading membrane proteinase PrsW (M82 family)